MNLPQIEGLELRYTIAEDGEYLKQWLSDPSVAGAFPMMNTTEVEDAVRHWIAFARYKSSLTALLHGQPVGIATLCLMPYKKLMHQCLLSIAMSAECRGQGIGTMLMNKLLHLGRSYFGIEVIYLEVYDGNPAIALYRRFGFKEVGHQRHFMKDGDRYLGKIIMERVM